MPDRKPLAWWSDALDVLRTCPDAIKQRVGFALDEAQLGGKAGSAKPKPDIGKGVHALTTNYDGETYRTFYAAHFPEAVFRSTRRTSRWPATARSWRGAGLRGIRDARRLLHHLSSPMSPTPSSGNVFADLGYDSEDAALLRFKARLLSALAAYVGGFDTQAHAAAALGVSRPRISEIRNGHLDKFSTDLLLAYCHRAGLRIPDFDLVPIG